MKSKQETIQEIAYFMWLNRGKPEGKDKEIWAEAEGVYNITEAGLITSKTKSTTTKTRSIKASNTKKTDEIKKNSKKENTKKVSVSKIIPIIKTKINGNKPTVNKAKTKIKIVLGKKK